MFSFKLVHVPGKEFVGLDGLSRWWRTEEDEEEGKTAEEAQQWVDDLYMCGLWVVDNLQKQGEGRIPGVGQKGLERGGDKNEVSVLVLKRKQVEATEDRDLPITEKGKKADEELMMIKKFLKTLERPKDLDCKTLKQFLKKSSKNFVHGKRLW